MKKIISSLIACLYGLTVSASTYELVVLDSSTNESGAYGVNNYGFVSGYKLENGLSVPYLWSPSKGFLALSKPSGAVSSAGIAYSINDNFEVVGTFGFFNNGGNVFHMGEGTAVAWVFDFGVTNFVPYQVATTPAMLRCINNNSEVAGQQNDCAFISDIYTGNGYNSPMGYSYCFGINDQGNATGMFISDSYNTILSPMFIQKGADGSYSMISGASIFSGGSYGVSAGTSINTNNQVVGISPAGGFYWEPLTGSNTVFGGGTTCYGINETGLIVGATNGHASMWQKNSKGLFAMTDLNKLIGSNTNIVLETALGVNDEGQIVGQCLNQVTGVRNAFMLTPSKGVSVTIAKGTNGLMLSWTAVNGHNYAIHTSTDLKTWTSLPDIYHADSTNAWISVIPNQVQMFFTVYDLTP